MSYNHNFTPECRTVRVGAPAAAGTGDTLTFTEIDTRGFRSARFILVTGDCAANAEFDLRVKASETTGSYGSGTVDDVVRRQFTATATSADNRTAVLEIHNIPRRYLRAQLGRAVANIVVDSVICELFNPVGAAQIEAQSGDSFISAVVSDPQPSAS